jgi:hypothetical protein
VLVIGAETDCLILATQKVAGGKKREQGKILVRKWYGEIHGARIALYLRGGID